MPLPLPSSWPTVRLAPGRDASARDGHPWVFSRALAGNQPIPDDGSLVHVVASDGSPLGVAGFSARSEIALRFFAMTAYGDGTVDLTPEGLATRFQQLAAEKARLAGTTNGYRLVHGEGDFLPGVIIDRYDAVFVVQLSTATAESLRSTILRALTDAFQPDAIVERSTSSARAAEGLAPVTGVLSGDVPPASSFEEDGATFLVDVLEGQKTGFFLDQREARRAVARFAAGRTLLNVCSYTGAFTIAATRAGAVASVNIDVSGPALEQLRNNLLQNRLDATKHECLELDVARALKSLKDQGRTFDLLVVDPPAFVKRRADLGAGTRAYIKTNAHALWCAKPGAIMLTSSCSQHVDPDHFRSILASAAAEAHRSIRILQLLQQAPDHTMRPQFPEGTYLKSALLLVE